MQPTIFRKYDKFYFNIISNNLYFLKYTPLKLIIDLNNILLILFLGLFFNN